MQALTQELDASKTASKRTLDEELALMQRKLQAAEEDGERAVAAVEASKRAAVEDAKRQAEAEVRAAQELARLREKEAQRKIEEAEEEQAAAYVAHLCTHTVCSCACVQAVTMCALLCVCQREGRCRAGASPRRRGGHGTCEVPGGAAAVPAPTHG